MTRDLREPIVRRYRDGALRIIDGALAEQHRRKEAALFKAWATRRADQRKRDPIVGASA
jgi:hypothetical protein